MAGLSNARAAPTSETIARMLVLLCQPPTVAATSVTAAPASMSWHTTAMRRRSTRSATWPTISVSSAIGTNCASPTSPRSSALPVSA
jgi:hypothetical protein